MSARLKVFSVLGQIRCGIPEETWVYVFLQLDNGDLATLIGKTSLWFRREDIRARRNSGTHHSGSSREYHSVVRWSASNPKVSFKLCAWEQGTKARANSSVVVNVLIKGIARADIL